MTTTTPNDATTPTQPSRTTLSLETFARPLATHTLPAPLQAMGFWAAIALPFLLVALLVGTGFDSPGDLLRFAGLLAANVAALAAGQGYQPG